MPAHNINIEIVIIIKYIKCIKWNMCENKIARLWNNFVWDHDWRLVDLYHEGINLSSLKGGRVTELIKTSYQKTGHGVLSGDTRRT